MNLDFIDKWKREIIPGTELSRRVWVDVTYLPKGATDKSQAKDISVELAKYFLGMTFNDNMTGTIDDVTIQLEDRARLWQSDWYPEKGATLNININTLNWSSLSEGLKTLPLGEFKIDEIEGVSSPNTINLKAVAVEGASSMRSTKKSKSWDKVTLKTIATEKATENGMQLFWDCSIDPTLEHVEQSRESDLALLHKLCKDAGFSLKVAKTQIFILDEWKYESQKPIMILLHPGITWSNEEAEENLLLSRVISYRYTDKTRDIFKGCRVRYQNSKKKTVIEAVFMDPQKKDDPTLDLLEVNEQIKDVAEGERLARKKLREKNAGETTFSLTIPGNTNVYASAVMTLKGFGKLDSDYLVTKCTHQITDSYTVSMDLRRCLHGY